MILKPNDGNRKIVSFRFMYFDEISELERIFCERQIFLKYFADRIFETARYLSPNDLHMAAKGSGMPIFLNSLTAKSILAGTKYSRSEGFLIAKHKHANIPIMTEPFPPPAPWF